MNLIKTLTPLLSRQIIFGVHAFGVNIFYVLLLIAAGVMPAHAAGQSTTATWHSTSAIEAAALSHVRGNKANAGTRTESRVKALDRRLKLARCGTQLETTTPSNARPGSTQIVEVRCASPHPWKIYVPISTATYRTVIVTKRPLLRGSTIGAGDVRLEEQDVTRINNRYLTELTQLEGRVLKQDVRAQTVLCQSVLGIEDIVRRGQSVTLMARNSKMNVRMRGEALSSAGKDERIRVKNLSSQRVVEGIVQSRQVVLVDY